MQSDTSDECDDDSQDKIKKKARKFFKSRTNPYNYLDQDCGFYLPGVPYTTVDWLKSIISEDRKVS